MSHSHDDETEARLADGTCAIDMRLTDVDVDVDEADQDSFYDIKAAAFNIIGLCVRQHRTGGYSAGVGRYIEIHSRAIDLH